MHFDIFNDPAFGLMELSTSIIDRPFQPGRLGQLNWFRTSGISTTSVSIERMGQALKLVPNAPRGANGMPIRGQKRSLRDIRATHLPQEGYVGADEVQNLRAFGSMTDVETVMTLVNRETDEAMRNLQLTLEWQRMGALKGVVLDSDGSTVLIDLATEFGLAMQTHDMALDNDATKVRIKTVEALRKVEDALGGLPYTGMRALCSASFFDALVGHPAVAGAFDRPREGAFLREDQRKGFMFADVWWEEYRGSIGGTPFIPANIAYLVPEGVPDMFITHFAPANYMETVNTIGLPMYVKKANTKYDKGIEFEMQSNPLHLNTRLNAIVALSI